MLPLPFSLMHIQSLAALTINKNEPTVGTVLFVHGWLDNAASFISVMSQLNRCLPDWQLIALDLPGHGQSQHKSSDHFYPFHDYIDDLHQVIRNLSPNPLVLVGHSLGGLLAACYSASFPERIAALMQIEAYRPLHEPASEAKSRLRQGILSRQRIRNKPQRYFATREDAIARRAHVNQLPPELIAPIVERDLIQEAAGWRWRHDRALHAQSLYRMDEMQANLWVDAITCPHTVVLGEQGFSQLRQTVALATRPKVVTVAGGHHCHLQSPIEVAQQIVGIVNKINTCC
ncbi:alpha/beta hydrolase [Vibrio sp. SM6]|uniref:Alpha/beta hydrolase n=1 Tax=Vibrio agarilyticus TaxID=2726741 RepID=A0A7X8YFJ2_9VIBR|nr:alpha/beta hydrolase [Vibrio agarilyticus]